MYIETSSAARFVACPDQSRSLDAQIHVCRRARQCLAHDPSQRDVNDYDVGTVARQGAVAVTRRLWRYRGLWHNGASFTGPFASQLRAARALRQAAHDDDDDDYDTQKRATRPAEFGEKWEQSDFMYACQWGVAQRDVIRADRTSALPKIAPLPHTVENCNLRLCAVNNIDCKKKIRERADGDGSFAWLSEITVFVLAQCTRNDLGRFTVQWRPTWRDRTKPHGQERQVNFDRFLMYYASLLHLCVYLCVCARGCE